MDNKKACSNKSINIIIEDKFNLWTKNLGLRLAMISVFEHIRDIPYIITPDLNDIIHGPAGLLNGNKGSCQPKHYLLKQMFEKLNIPVKFVTYLFRWDISSVQYPDELRSIVSKLPISYHLACKAYINQKWVVVDATWDLPLKKAGFPVNESWDGESDTLIAVIPIEENVQESAEDRIEYEMKKKNLYSDQEKHLYVEFVNKFNTWLEDIRK
ncbi:MAG: hypothetical protein PHO70_03855 [Candidatus Omnitrophica bacterium]|nr:hypothetical protein [Candidatus Omnitrophota bacterium]